MTPGRNTAPEEANVTAGGPVGKDTSLATVVGVDFGTLSARAVVSGRASKRRRVA